ncbi:MAG: acyl carrier protein [Clostridiales bacterium]|nr:acyl carrier protein [Clostridiales bacterium]
MDKLKSIITKYVDVKPEDIGDNMSLNADLNIDSFSLISMIVEIEESFNVEIPDYAISKFQTLTDLYNFITA